MTKILRAAFAATIVLSSLLRALPAAAAEQTVTILPSADTYITGDNNGSSNFGSGTALALFMDFSNTGRTLIRFDLSSIPAGATISSASMGMELTYSSGSQSVNATAYRVTESWTETAVNQNTQPAHGDELVITPVLNVPQKYTWDVTDAVRNWVSGAWQNHGIKIIGREGASSSLNYRREFGSRESGTPPTLIVTYTPPADTTGPTITNVAAAMQSDSSVRITWNTNEPATASVEYGATAEYGRTQNDVGYALEQSMTLTGLAAGTYHYRVRSADMAGNSSVSSDFTFMIGASPPPAATPPPASETSYRPGDLVKLVCPANADINDPCKAVYYLGSDGKRHAFPNAKIYFTWFADFGAVKTMPSVEVLSPIPLGANVRYKPGSRMIKFATLAKVYAVSRGGVLRWVTSEAVARDLYGADWNKKIDDLSDAFAFNYSFGADITSAADFNVANEQTATIDADLAVTLSLTKGDATISSYHESSPPQPSDTTAPYITSVFAFDNSEKGGLTITWDTNESATGVVEFGSTTSYGQTFSASQYSSPTHVIVNPGSMAPGTYHFRIRATDTAGNTRTTGDFLLRTDGNEAVYQDGRLIKLACPAGADASHPCRAVYYAGYDGKRHPFPNAKIYATWYADFRSVVTVSSDEMSSYPLGASVRYKPGVRMVKFATNPKVYAISRGGSLVWINSEGLARTLYGFDWNKQIDDLSDAFAADYSILEPSIFDPNNYSPQIEISGVTTIEQDLYRPLG